jgi:hypothetical protein
MTEGARGESDTQILSGPHGLRRMSEGGAKMLAESLLSLDGRVAVAATMSLSTGLHDVIALSARRFGG